MKRLFLPLLIFGAACASVPSSSTRTEAQPGHGALSIRIEPNPIQAHVVNGSTYEFPFDVVLRETGGHRVTINRVSAEVTALAGLHVDTVTYDATQIANLGYSTQVPANGEARYHFSPQQSVPDDRLFGGVIANLTVEGTDDTGAPTIGRTAVTVSK